MFKSIEEQHKWFLENYRDETKKLLRKLFANDCGDFQKFLDTYIKGKSYNECMHFKNNPKATFSSIAKSLNSDKVAVSKRLHKIIVYYYDYIKGLYSSDIIKYSDMPTMVKNLIMRLGISTKDELIDFINSNGGIENCFKGKRGIGHSTIEVICDYTGIKRVFYEERLSDIKRFNLIKDYIRNGGTDIEEVKNLVGDL